MKSRRTIFANIAIEGNIDVKHIAHETVHVDSHAFLVGGNWKFSWKKIENVQTDPGGGGLTITTGQDGSKPAVIECLGVDRENGPKFLDFVKKRWQKVQRLRQLDNDKEEKEDEAEQRRVFSFSSRRKRNKTYGRSRLSRPSRFTTSSTNWSSDEEMDRPKRDMEWSQPSPRRPHVEAKEEEEEAVLVEEEEEMPDIVVHDDDKECGTEKEETVDTTTTSTKRTQLKRLTRRSVGVEPDSEDEDDFFATPSMTTPTTSSSNRIVSPTALQDDDDDDEEMDDPEASDNHRITTFFGSKPLSATVVHTPTTKSTQTPAGKTPPRPPLSQDTTTWLETPPSRPKETRLSPIASREEDSSPVVDVTTPPPAQQIYSTPPARPTLNLKVKKRLGGANRHGSAAKRARQGTTTSPVSALPELQPRLCSIVSTSPVARLAITKNPYTVPRWRGLSNLGNTCYMNASLQMLFTLQGLVSGLAGSNGPLSQSLVSTADMLLGSKTVGAVSPRQVKWAMDDLTDKFRGYEQRDAHEFLSELVDRVHDEEEEEKAEDQTNLLTDDFFRINVRVCLTCDSCGYKRTKDEVYRHLSIDVEESTTDDNDEEVEWSVGKGIAKFFRKETREVICEKCPEGKTATQTQSVLECPKAVLVHFKRFVVTERPVIRSLVKASENSNKPTSQSSPSVRMVIQKNKAPVQLDPTISLKDYASEDGAVSSRAFEISSVVHHIGATASSGHYTADARRRSLNEDSTEWVSFDDGSAYKCPNIGSERNKRTAYMCLYSAADP